MAGRYNSYMICTSPRSGSTLLCRMLAATGVAGKPDSHFHEPSLDAWAADYDLRAEDFADERDFLKVVFQAAVRHGSDGQEIFGLRLQRRSFDFFMAKAAVLHPQAASGLARIEAAFGRTLFIHLTRRDKLAQAVSFIKADQTGLWHRAADGSELERLSPPADPVYDRDLIRRQIGIFEGFDQGWNQWFGDQGMEPVRIVYEDFSKDPKAVLQQLMTILGHGPEAAEGIEPPVARLTDRVNRAWMDRYRADTNGAAD